ncbi:MAG: DUF3422 family protein, partial [Pseudomonadota bacterium]|nr:DUF3422 family protein [Pseudomonadota bacterium]
MAGRGGNGSTNGGGAAAGATGEAARHVAEMKPHPERAAALGEIHARPVPPVEPDRVVLHFAFMAEGGTSVSHALFAELCRGRGDSPPHAHARYHEIDWGNGSLRWERHSEFTTFLWEGKVPARFRGPVAGHPFGSGFTQPGMLISAARVEVRKQTPSSLRLLERFEQESLCVTTLDGGSSLVATDFRQDGDGMTVFLLLVDNLVPARIGHFVKTVIELETYRTL